MRHKLLPLLCTFSLMIGLVGVSGCTTAETKTTVTGYKLNTIVQLDAYVKTSTDVLNNALNLCDTYEKMFSRTREDSLLYQVNHHQITEIPDELAELIQYGITYSEQSKGAFDLTIGSVSQLWDFTADNPKVPDAAAIQEALQYVDYRNVTLTRNPNSAIPSSASTTQSGTAQSEDSTASSTWTISIPEGTVIDLGAIAKGYIADRIKDYLLENGVTRAVINLGGNVLCVGRKTDTADFSIGIKKPFSQNGESLAVLSLNDQSAVSSGTYERYFYEGDQFYHHILNPKTGYPYANALTDVTIISDASVIGDCLSTTCFTLGLDEGMKLIESLDGIEAIFVTDDGNIHYSSGAKAFIKK